MFSASAYFRDWLETEGCEECIPVFHECGIDNPTDLLSLSLDELQSLGVPETSLDRLWTAMSTTETTRPAARSATQMFSKRDSTEKRPAARSVTQMFSKRDSTKELEMPQRPPPRKRSIWEEKAGDLLIMGKAMGEAQRAAEKRLVAELTAAERKADEQMRIDTAVGAATAATKEATQKAEAEMAALVNEVERLRVENTKLSKKNLLAVAAAAPPPAPPPSAVPSLVAPPPPPTTPGQEFVFDATTGSYRRASVPSPMPSFSPVSWRPPSPPPSLPPLLAGTPRRARHPA